MRISRRAEIYAEALFSLLPENSDKPKTPEASEAPLAPGAPQAEASKPPQTPSSRPAAQTSPAESLLEQMQELSSVSASPGKERDFLLSPLAAAKFKKQAFEALPPLVKNFLFVLIDNNALLLLPQITEAFKNLLNNRLRREEGEIVSARPLPPEDKSRLEDALSASFFKNRSLRLRQTVDPSLVGGLFVRTRDYVFNDTAAFHLKQFEKNS